MTRLADYAPGAYEPWAHQEAAFAWLDDKPEPFAALAHEQRCGKTRVALGHAVRLFRRGEVTALVVVAMPGDVHANWVTDECPAWLPPDLRWRGLAWRASRAHLKSYQQQLDELVAFPGLAILTVNGEAVVTETFRRYLGRFLKARERAMVCVDEQTLVMKSPHRARHGSRRSKVMMAIARLAQVRYRLSMDGTPVGEGPFDLFTPYEFLKPHPLTTPGLLGTRTWTEFKTTYAEYEEGYDPRSGRTFPRLRGFKNLDRLHALMAPHTHRVRRADCLDLPAKVYVPAHRFDLSKEQRRVYDALRDEYLAEFASGLPLTAEHALTRALRLQQVTSNFIPAIRGLAVCPACLGEGCEACDDLGALETTVPARRLDEAHHPRLEALREQLELTSEPVIVWARFRQDVEDVLGLCRDLGRDPVRYDGACSADEKLAARRTFQAGGSGALVGSTRAGGRGLRLDRAGSLHYYSNEFALLLRLQSEDRAEAVGKATGTGVHDYSAYDTVDETIVVALRSKRSVADLIMDEDSGAWI